MSTIPGPTHAPAQPWLVPLIALAAIWGSSFLFIKVAVEEIEPLYVAFGRCLIGATFLLGVLAVRGDRLPRRPRTWGHIAVAAVLLNSVPFVLFAYGETRASSVLAGIWNATTPLFALSAALIALPEERPNRARVIGLLIGLAGVLVVLGPWSGTGGSGFLGQLMFGGAAMCYGLAFPYTQRFLAAEPNTGLSLAAAQVMIGALQLALVLPLVGTPSLSGGVDVVGSMLALGVFGTGVAYVLNYAVIRRAGSTTASTVTYLIPLFSTVLGVTVLSETLAWHHPVGAAIVLAGIAFSQGRRTTPPGSSASRPVPSV